MGRADILGAIYARVTDMTVANGFNFDWSTVKSDINGARVTDNVVLNAKYGNEEVLDVGVTAQLEYNLEIPVKITGIGFKGISTIATEQYDIEVYKSKLADDIRYAFGIEYDALCTAGGYELTYVGEVESEDIVDELKQDGYEVEVSLEYRIKFRTARRGS